MMAPRAPEPRLDEGTELLEEGERDAIKLYRGFLDFAFSGNVVKIAFGIVVGTAFTALTHSLVSDVILPSLSVVFPLNRNMDEKFAVLQPGPHYEDLGGYNTVAEAHGDGAVVLSYGNFIDKLVNFFGTGLALYLVALIYQYTSHDPHILVHWVRCRYCEQ